MEDIQKKYSSFVAKRAKPMGSQINDVMHSSVGISGEAGEILDTVKKSWIYGKDLNTDNLREELGDLFFYMQMMCNTFGWTFTDIIEQNIQKLSIRYPEAYTDELAIKRLDKVDEQQ